MATSQKNKNHWQAYAFLLALTTNILNPAPTAAKEPETNSNDRKKTECERHQEEINTIVEYISWNPLLQQALETMIYSSTNELSFDVYRQEEKYQFIFHEDHSDPAILGHIGELQEDPTVQHLTQSLQRGEVEKIPRFVRRLDTIIGHKLRSDWWRRYSNEEWMILSNLRKEVSSTDYAQELAVMIESNSRAEYERNMDNGHVAILKKSVERLELSIIVLEGACSLGEKILLSLEHQEARKALEEDLRNTQPRIAASRIARDSAKETIQMITGRYSQAATTTPSENEETRYRQDLATLVWRPLIDSNVRFRVRLEPRQPLLKNSQIITQGHTHPIFLPDDLRYFPGEPSRTDERNGSAELLFTALPHEWRIYTTVCGESTLARKYSREKL